MFGHCKQLLESEELQQVDTVSYDVHYDDRKVKYKALNCTVTSIRGGGVAPPVMEVTTCSSIVNNCVISRLHLGDTVSYDTECDDWQQGNTVSFDTEYSRQCMTSNWRWRLEWSGRGRSHSRNRNS